MTCELIPILKMVHIVLDDIRQLISAEHREFVEDVGVNETIELDV